MTQSQAVARQYPGNSEITEWQQVIASDPQHGIERLQARIRGLYGSQEWLTRFNANDRQMLGFLAWAQARVVEE